ncbi:amidohydrolase [Reyranella sp. MMS21-HV4-11]|jgi:hippurate hydrolase|uniref:Amidohydrolase n=1 Tax=Reyranella humidisoli TaxID=2849149 RepID=A0ABS6IKH1_9HYPH|nr:M20 aminoacylase family protein [Reyranella sp. MMS21-HV4-11]MBU8874384.1 amidohydrolase [Reyranella sp. MMS21-HV4-11]
MPVLPRALEIQGEISAIRRDIHAHPELAFEENRTSDVVAAKLQEWGLEVTRGLGKTGLVGTLRKGNSLKSIGLRADMDCLPMDETNDFAHRSTNPGRMHACGHDGHTAMLLGAAKMLSETRNFEGAVHFIFQPAEEGGGGAKVMIEDGLFEKFPCDAVFAIHNKPGLPLGHIVTKGGPLLAAADRWDIRIKGKGGHAAHPHTTLDPMVVGANIVMALQTIVSRNIDPIDSSVVTVGFFHAGSAYNVIPGEAHIGGTTRTTTPENRALIERRIDEICEGAARMHGVKIEVEHKPGYPPTVNDVDQARFAADVATGVCGEHAVKDNTRPSMGAEDFSYMLEKVPGAMVWLGNGGDSVSLHNSRYDFNDMAIPFGVSFFVRTVERFLDTKA